MAAVRLAAVLLLVLVISPPHSTCCASSFVVLDTISLGAFRTPRSHGHRRMSSSGMRPIALAALSSFPPETMAAAQAPDGRHATFPGTQHQPGDRCDEVVVASPSAFDTLAGNAALCLVRSDLKRDDGFDGASTGWTSWVDDASAFRLQKCMENLVLGISPTKTGYADATDVEALAVEGGRLIDDSDRWIRWLKTCPIPCRVEWTVPFRRSVDAALDNETLHRIDSAREAFLRRVGCRLYALPSGRTLSDDLKTPPGAMVYGKLLHGGVTRFRLIGGGSRRRRVGERRVVVGSTTPASASGPWKRSANDNGRDAAWLQYGGPERNYEAVDMGPCLVLEVTLLPKGLEVPILDATTAAVGGDLILTEQQWHPRDMFDFAATASAQEGTEPDEGPSAPTGKADCHGVDDESSFSVCDLETAFCSTVGGLRPQIDEIVRRVLDGRALRPATPAGSNGTDDEESSSGRALLDRLRREEMVALAELGLQPVRGLLLYGPPGCGKTALAREISSILDARPAKIVAAPELLDRWVGGSEKLVRDLFADAESELRRCRGDATRSALHVIVIDEIDAVFRRRSASTPAAGTVSSSSGEIARASAVNQILAKLDGVTALGNVLLMGMTNRRELIDPALLRPGRLEVQIEVPLPDARGRREILHIHTAELRRRGRLSKPLCDAIDGRGWRESLSMSEDVERYGVPKWLRYLVRMRRRRPLMGIRGTARSKEASMRTGSTRIWDLAAERWTGGFSGADLAGLVRCAGSLALARARQQEEAGTAAGIADSLLITLEDVVQALREVRQ